MGFALTSMDILLHFSPAPVLLQLGLTNSIQFVWTREVSATYVRVVASCNIWHLML